MFRAISKALNMLGTVASIITAIWLAFWFAFLILRGFGAMFRFLADTH